MKGNERLAKRNLSAAELEAELRQTEEKLFRLAFKHTVTPAANPMELRSMRRHVARLKTWIRERQLEAPAPEAAAKAPVKAAPKAARKTAVGAKKEAR